MAALENLEPIHTHDDLLAPFHAACKPESEFRIGTEAEKFGVYVGPPPSAVPYEGEHGVRRILHSLSERSGWTMGSEYEGGPILSLTRGRASVTLEPGGQLELSGAPLATIHETCAELHGHMKELAGISEELGIIWLGLGFHPLARQQDLPWVPKMRYPVMREYLPTRGSMAHDMMRRTCTVQANMDFSSEADAMRKLRLSMKIQPIVTAMFANSPFYEGNVDEHRTRRGLVWLNMDPDRGGLLPFCWSATATFEDYVQWALDVPMFMFKRDNQVFNNAGQKFRDFLKNGFQGQQATKGDWETQLNTVFPEVRLKRTLEVRGADSQQTPLACALPALWKGLLYSDASLDALEELTESLNYEDVERARPEIVRTALQAELGGKLVQKWAERLLEIAHSALDKMDNRSSKGNTEAIHLARLETLVSKGQSPADALLADMDLSRDLVPQILEKTRI